MCHCLETMFAVFDKLSEIGGQYADHLKSV